MTLRVSVSHNLDQMVAQFNLTPQLMHAVHLLKPKASWFSKKDSFKFLPFSYSGNNWPLGQTQSFAVFDTTFFSLKIFLLS